MKATPGPWRFTSRNIDEKANWKSRIPFAIEFVAGRSAVAPIADIVANPIVEVCDQPHAEANARLIAAAPDLLDTLSECLTVINTAKRFLSRDELKRAEDAQVSARAAIKKATGEQS